MNKRPSSFPLAPPPSSERRSYIRALRESFEQGELDCKISADALPFALFADLFGHSENGRAVWALSPDFLSKVLLVCVEPWRFMAFIQPDTAKPEL